MEVDDKEAENDKAFISKLLCEMKTQFNKAEKKPSPSLLKVDEEVNLNSSVAGDMLEINANSLKSLPSKTEPEAPQELPAKVSVKQEKMAVTPEAAINNNIADVEKQPIKEESAIKEDSDEKPRIVLTFRKPSNESLKKPKDESAAAKRNLRAKVHVVDDTITPKRSPRRRSRDCNESVLQSAIARKEKSYNEASKPQRLTRQLKATPKILENLANAALKLEKTRTDKSKIKPDKSKAESDSELLENCEEVAQSDVEEKNGKKHKLQTKNYKVNAKRLKTCESRDSDSDHSLQEKEVEKFGNSSDSKSKIVKCRPGVAEDKLNKSSRSRRSHRLSTKRDDASPDDSVEFLEPDTAEQDSFYPSNPECSPAEAQLSSARLCLCTHKTPLYVSAANDDIVYCTAVDTVGDKLVGCNSVVDASEVPMLRPSSRVPYIILCEVHLNRILRHNCCPKCGLFCTQGRFAQCEAKHQYHRECQITIGETECCPHCGLPTPDRDVLITMHSSKKPVFLPTQKAQYPVAKMSFQPKFKKGLESPQTRASSPMIPPNFIEPISLQNPEGSEKYDVETLFYYIKESDLEKLAIILGSRSVPLATALEECNGGTVLHYVAQTGQLAVIHMLVMARAELDVLDREQNSPLVCAILNFKNNVVKYLIKAGASIVLKGTDGMTALHIAAKSGNLNACELLVNAASGKKNYINLADDGGWTPLVWACEHAHLEVVKFLLRKGADPLLRDVEQNIALHWAAFSGSADIAELLLNNRSQVNAVNAHGDSPLHIGARQNMYNCILILLARGANVSLVNKIGESPLDCVEPMGECYTAISLNVQLQTLTASDKPTKTILTNDISRGREMNPIQCVNTTDEEPLPTDFVYISSNCITSNDINVDRKITTMHSCQCEEKCITFNCVCCNNSLRCWYDEDGKLLSDFNYTDPPMIFECNQLCGCNAITCNNRVVQHGLTQRFQLFKTETKGWGIRTLRNIAKGTYVCEYVGEIVSDQEADRRVDDSYLFDLDNRVCMALKDTDSFCIDAKHYGNLARFINHSCEPNLVPIRVFIEHHDLRFPRIAFFANRDIAADEELSFNYGEKFWIIKYKSFTCDCGSSNCKYSEDTIFSTVKDYNSKMQEAS